MTALIWFRTDLRVHDQPALRSAQAAGQQCVAVYCLTPKTWEYHEAAPIKIDFIKRALEALRLELAALYIPLFILETDTYEETPPALLDFIRQNQVSSVHFNIQYEIDEQKRDEAALALFLSEGLKVFRFHDRVLIQPGLVLSGQNTPFKIFSAFRKRWLQCSENVASQPISIALQSENRSQTGDGYDLEALRTSLNFDQPVGIPKSDGPEAQPSFLTALSPVWPASERAAIQRFYTFLQVGMRNYHLTRDYPAQETSWLSPYFAQGMLSIRFVIQALKQETQQASLLDILSLPGYGAWLNELIWREFYTDVLFHCPKLACHQEMKKRVRSWIWREEPVLFQAWCEGKTGFPLIDAGMRQLNEVGWMHNRLRMNVAQFLSKLLRIDWRWGESYFSKHLIDGDLCANNGGWQWCAGTGTDAAPYFRIFNPTLQSERFDPQGEFIRKYCPELKDFSAKAIHAPHQRDPLRAEAVGYPKPIIDYAQARQEFLAML